MERLIGTGAAILFKGSGFYETDYRSESYKKAAEADTKGTDAKSDAPKSPESKTSEQAAPAPQSPKLESKTQTKPAPASVAPSKPTTARKNPRASKKR